MADYTAAANRKRAAWAVLSKANSTLDDRVAATVEIMMTEYELSAQHAAALGHFDQHPAWPEYVAGALFSKWKCRRFDGDVLDALRQLYPPQRLRGMVVNSWTWTSADPATPEPDRRFDR